MAAMAILVLVLAAAAAAALRAKVDDDDDEEVIGGLGGVEVVRRCSRKEFSNRKEGQDRYIDVTSALQCVW